MLILAPMQGLTEVLFRRTFSRCFPGSLDMAVSPFLSLTHGNLADAWKKICDVLPEANEGLMPVVPQILGKECEEFVALANRLHDVGYDEVNWNIGCPMRRVAGKHRGSGILPYPDEVRRVLDGVVPHLKTALSIKMRLGHQHDDEILRLIPILNEYPLKSITIHPRTGKQQYGGSVNLERFGEVLPMLRHPVIYNGDIRTVGDYRHIIERFPQVKDVMIGRGVLYNPLLPSQIKGIAVSEADARHFIAELVGDIDRQPISDEAKIRKTKEYWCLLWHATSLTETESRALLRTPDLKTLQEGIMKVVSTT